MHVDAEGCTQNHADANGFDFLWIPNISRRRRGARGRPPRGLGGGRTVWATAAALGPGAAAGLWGGAPAP